MSNKMAKMFLVVPVILLMSLPAPAQAHPDFHLISQHDMVFHNRKFPASSSLKVDKAGNTLTFSGSLIQLLVTAGPPDAMLSYRIAGLTNPTLRIPVGTRLRLTVVNVDDDMVHDLVISAPQVTYPVQPKIPPGVVHTHPLSARRGESMQAQELVVQPLRPGSFDYFCSTPAHAKGGMHGRLEVFAGSQGSSRRNQSKRGSDQGGSHD